MSVMKKSTLLTLGVSLGLSLLVIEVIIRVTMPNWHEFYNGRFMRLITVPGHGVVTTGRPGFDGYFSQNNGDFRVRISINDFGLRNPEPVGTADGSVWVIGDSMTFGWGVEREEMYSEIIESELAVDSYNMASPGTDVCGYQALYARIPQTLKPKAVIVGLVLENDVLQVDCKTVSNATAGKTDGDETEISMIAVKLALTKYSAIYNFLAVTLKRLKIVREILTDMGIVNKEHEYKGAFPKANMTPRVEITASELARLKDMVPPGTPFAVLVIPGRFEIRDDDPFYRRLRIEVIRFLEQRSIDVIDLLEEFKKTGFEPIHFTHDGHWSPLGHRIAGKAVAKWLRNLE